MFCNKKLQDKIDLLQKRASWIIYNEPILNLDELAELEKRTYIHKNTITLLAEVFEQLEEKIQDFLSGKNELPTENNQLHKLS